MNLAPLTHSRSHLVSGVAPIQRDPLQAHKRTVSSAIASHLSSAPAAAPGPSWRSGVQSVVYGTHAGNTDENTDDEVVSYICAAAVHVCIARM